MGFRDPSRWHRVLRLGGGVVAGAYGAYRTARENPMGPRRPGPPIRRRKRRGPMLAIGQVGNFGGQGGEGAHLTITKARGSYTAKNKENRMGLLLTKETDMYRGLSRFDTNTGWYRLGFVTGFGSGDAVEPPMTIVNLLPMYPNVGTAAEGWAHMRFIYPLGVPNENPLRTQQPGMGLDGTAFNDLYLPTDTNAETPLLTTNDNFRKALFSNIQVKMNLYGARFRNTDFYIDLVSPKDDETDFASADLNNQEFKGLLDSLTRPLMYSNILETVNNRVPSQKLRYLKRWRFTVPASTSSDLNTAVGNLKEVSLNLKLKRLVSYMRKDEMQVAAISAGGSDDIIPATNIACKVLPNETKRVYLIIRAFAPQVYNIVAPAEEYADIVPSFDMSVKRTYTRAIQTKPT